MKRKETVDIIGELVASMNLDIVATSVVNNMLDNTFYTCNTLHLQKGYVVTVGLSDYVVSDITPNVSVTLTGTPSLTALNFTAYTPFYKHGTIITTNVELDKADDANQITPLVYLREVFVDKFNNTDSSFDRESSLEIFFLAQNSFSETEDDIRSYGLLPMRNLVYRFIETLNNHKDIGKFSDYEIKDWLRFGFETQNGATKKIFNFTDLTGCQLNISIPIKKNFSCCTN